MVVTLGTRHIRNAWFIVWARRERKCNIARRYLFRSRIGTIEGQLSGRILELASENRDYYVTLESSSSQQSVDIFQLNSCHFHISSTSMTTMNISLEKALS